MAGRGAYGLICSARAGAFGAGVAWRYGAAAGLHIRHGHGVAVLRNGRAWALWACIFDGGTMGVFRGGSPQDLGFRAVAGEPGLSRYET